MPHAQVVTAAEEAPLARVAMAATKMPHAQAATAVEETSSAQCWASDLQEEASEQEGTTRRAQAAMAAEKMMPHMQTATAAAKMPLVLAATVAAEATSTTPSWPGK